MEPERRRRRPAVSCILCRRRKVRCNRQRPCSNCTKSRNATCSYRDHPQPSAQPPRQGSLGDDTNTAARSRTWAPETGPLTPSTDVAISSAASAPSHYGPLTNPIINPVVDSQPPARHDKPARSRAAPQQAESLAATASSAGTPISRFTKNPRVETKTVNIAGNFHFHAEHRVATQPQAVTRSVTHKTRLFGQSHWVNAVGLLSDMFHVLERLLRDDTCKFYRVEKQCKSLGKIIKSRRTPPWPCPPTPELPARAVADALVECYLTTSETILRVLHIPRFRREYEAVWDPSNSTDPAFLVQLKLILAIGTPTHDSAFSMRQHATRWVYEAQTWLSAPEFKSRLGIPSLQTSVLLLIARQAVGVGEDMIWAALGSTLRLAMYMGLHRDPAVLGPRTTTQLVNEMRRRLWNTILEMTLQKSLNSGGPPLINSDDFDTEPPGNFDDDQLADQQDVGDAVSSPPTQFTQTAMAIALRDIFPHRLAIVKYLNDLSSRGTYAELLRLDTELREAYKTLTRTFQTYKTPPSTSTFKTPLSSELRAVDILLRRYFLALHLPFFSAALTDPTFAFSRRVAVESALRLWRAAFPLPLSVSPDTATVTDDPLARIAFSGSAFFRTVVVQALVVIAVELKTLLREEEDLGLGPVQLRPDLLLALQDFKAWAWRSMETGETNTKGYLVACMVAAHVEGLRRGLGEQEVVEGVVKATEEAAERSLGLLQEIEARGRPAQEDTPPVGMGVVGGLGLTPEFGLEDWDYMASDALFNSVGQDPLSWVFQ